MEIKYSFIWFIIALSAACIAFGIVMAWFQERDEKKAHKRLQEHYTNHKTQQICKTIRMRSLTQQQAPREGAKLRRDNIHQWYDNGRVLALLPSQKLINNTKI